MTEKPPQLLKRELMKRVAHEIDEINKESIEKFKARQLLKCQCTCGKCCQHPRLKP